MSTACSGGVRFVVYSDDFELCARALLKIVRSMLAMPRLVRALSADLGDAPVFYLHPLSRPAGRADHEPARHRDGYPPGTLLTTGPASSRDGCSEAAEPASSRPSTISPTDAECALGAPRGRRGARSTDIPRLRTPPPGPGGGDGLAAGVRHGSTDARRGRGRGTERRGAPPVGARRSRDRTAPDRLDLGLVPLRARAWQCGHPSQCMDRGQCRPPAGAWTCVLRRLGERPGDGGRRRLGPVRGVAGGCRSAPPRRRTDGGRGAVRGGRTGSEGTGAAVARPRRRRRLAGGSEPDARPRGQRVGW